MNVILDAHEVMEKMNEQDVRLVDCRFTLGKPDMGKTEYDRDHIPSAVFFDLERDLSGSVQVHGGRHPLPDIKILKKKLEDAGISRSTTVIAYDDGHSASAARFIWILIYLGHSKVFLLNRGYSVWKENNYPVTNETPVFKQVDFLVSYNEQVAASYEEIVQFTQNESKVAVLIDSRDNKRYAGREEPIDKKAGHIPGALNYDWSESFKNGYFLPKEEQKKRFGELDHDQEVIVYCGSGITAAANFVALKEAGFKRVKLYTGSFSDWISYEDNPVITDVEIE